MVKINLIIIIILILLLGFFLLIKKEKYNNLNLNTNTNTNEGLEYSINEGNYNNDPLFFNTSTNLERGIMDNINITEKIINSYEFLGYLFTRNDKGYWQFIIDTDGDFNLWFGNKHLLNYNLENTTMNNRNKYFNGVLESNIYYPIRIQYSNGTKFKFSFIPPFKSVITDLKNYFYNNIYGLNYITDQPQGSVQNKTTGISYRLNIKDKPKEWYGSFFTGGVEGNWIFYIKSKFPYYFWLGGIAYTHYTRKNCTLANDYEGDEIKNIYLLKNKYYPIRIKGSSDIEIYFKPPNGSKTNNGFGYFYQHNFGLTYTIYDGNSNNPDWFKNAHPKTKGLSIEFNSLYNSVIFPNIEYNLKKKNKYENYSIEWTGKMFTHNNEGKWKFGLETLNPAYLWLGESAIDNYNIDNALVKTDNKTKNNFNEIELKGNTFYPIRIQYTNDEYDNDIFAYFTPPDFDLDLDMANSSIFSLLKNIKNIKFPKKNNYDSTFYFYPDINSIPSRVISPNIK
jgi:hypothetical protein